ncbi:MAG: hypothetical protein GY950_18250, partial [bacterium]|nr:hypothetical protein [bacterium]
MGTKILKKISSNIKESHPFISQWLEAMDVSAVTKMVRHGFIRDFVFKNFDVEKF